MTGNTSAGRAAGTYDVVWPRGERCVTATPLAPRQRDLPEIGRAHV